MVSDSAADRAYADVRSRIVAGELPGGALLAEGEVAERLGMSRTPVREAFLRLQAEGWMRLYPKRGALIVPVAPAEAREVLEARVLLESHAVEAVVADPARAAALAAELDRIAVEQRELGRRGDVAGHATADADFHLAIVAAGGNSLLEAFYRSLRDRQVRMMTAVPLGSPTETVVGGGHRALVDAVRARDADAFAALLRDHLEAVHGQARR